MKQHPLSAAFPAMPEEDFDALVADIEKHGLREPVVVLDNMVLDGWHRYRACERAGVAASTVLFDGDDPRSFVLSRNLHRRHLNGSQRAIAIVECSKWRPSGVTGSRGEAASSLTNSEMAKAAEVSDRTIKHAKAAHTAGLGEAVKEGVVSAERAAEIAKLPAKKREEALKEPRKPKVVAAGRDIERLYEQAKEELAETREALAEMRDLAASAKAFEEEGQFKEMQVLRLELRSAKRRRDELMRENAELKKQVAYWKKKAEKK